MEQIVEKYKFFVGTLEKRNIYVIQFFKNLHCNTLGNYERNFVLKN